MATIKFYVQSNNNPAGIYVRLRQGRSIDAKAKTNYVINPTQWSAKKGQPINLKDAGLKKLNQDLTDFKAKLLTHYNKCVGTTEIDSNWLKEFINPPANDAIPTLLIPYFDYFLKHRKNSISGSSLVKYKVIKHLMQRFEKKMKKSFAIRDINADFKLKFEEYCQAEGYSRNTMARAFKFIKTVCYDAHNNGLETHHQLKGLTTRVEKVHKVFLTPEEIDQIYHHECSTDYLDNARDWLVISCETGQRVSDFLDFTKANIRYEEMVKGGKKVRIPLIDFRQVKTKKLVAVPLSRKVTEILEKRNGEFPRKISSQNYNEYIKLVCKEVGLTEMIQGGKLNPETKRKEVGVYPKYELVTSHIGRRSFATNNYGKIPTSLLISATGHSTEKMFLEYIGKSPTEAAMQLAEYFV